MNARGREGGFTLPDLARARGPLTDAASFKELAQLTGRKPYALMLDYLEHLSRVLKGWDSPRLELELPEEAALVHMASVHIQNALACTRALLLPCADCTPGEGCASNEPATESTNVHTERDEEPPLSARLRALAENEPPADVGASAGGTHEGATAKKPYAPPTLTHLGSVRELTRFGGSRPPHRPGLPRTIPR